jgi:hypothetical protein
MLRFILRIQCWFNAISMEFWDDAQDRRCGEDVDFQDPAAISPRKTEAMSGCRFINSQGELQAFGRQEGGSGLKYLVRFMLG